MDAVADGPHCRAAGSGWRRCAGDAGREDAEGIGVAAGVGASINVGVSAWVSFSVCQWSCHTGHAEAVASESRLGAEGVRHPGGCRADRPGPRHAARGCHRTSMDACGPWRRQRPAVSRHRLDITASIQCRRWLDAMSKATYVWRCLGWAIVTQLSATPAPPGRSSCPAPGSRK